MAYLDTTTDLAYWAEVPNCNGRYICDIMGRIWSRRHHRYLRHHTRRSGYKHVVLRTVRGFRTVLVHRVVAVAFHGRYAYKAAEVMHLNSQRGDNRLENLQWGTRRKNEKMKEEFHKERRFWKGPF